MQNDLREACAATAREIDEGVVYCPPIVPRGDLFVHLAGQGLAPGTYTIDLQMAQGTSRFGHWLIAGGNPRSLAAELERNAASSHSLRIEGVQLKLFRIRPFSQGGGEQGGHISVYWTHDGRGYIVSFHGYDEEPAALAVTQGLIEEMERCPEEDAEQDDEGSCAGVYPHQSPVRPAPASLQRKCRQIAAGAKAPVYCPPLVPAGPLQIEAMELEEQTPGAYLLSFRSPIRAGGESGGWRVQSGEAGTLSRLVTEAAQSSRPIDLGGLPGRFVLTVSPGLGGGALAKSVVVVWSFEGRDYLVAMKGFENEDLVQQLATAMAKQMRS